MTKENAKGLVNAISDSSYSHPIDAASKIHAIKSQEPVYMYHFGYKGQNSFSQLATDTYPPKLKETDIKYGVGNGDDLIYLFPVLSGAFRPLPHDDLIFSQRFIELLMSFAKTGKPTIVMQSSNKVEIDVETGENATTTEAESTTFTWEPVHQKSATHLDIGNVMKMDDGLPNHERMNFWHQMPAYWTCDRAAYKPAPPVVYRDEL